MYGNNELTYKDRLEIAFRLKAEQLLDVILGKYKVTFKDIINLVSDLTEIYQTAKFIEQKEERYLR